MTDVCVALDIEATGMEPGRDEIIEIGAVKFRGARVIDRFESLVRPSSQITLSIQSLTGLSNDDLRRAPLFPLVAPRLRDFVGQAPIVGQSVNMDLAMLEAAGLRFPNTRYDTFELATVLLPELPAYNLATVAAALGVDVPSSHRAVVDAETTQAVFNRLVERADRFDDATLERLITVASAGGGLVAAGALVVIATPVAPLVYVGLVLIGVGCAPIVPTAFSAAGRLPGLASGTGISLVGFALRLGLTLNSPLMGAVAERSSVRAAFGIVVIAGLAACLLAWRYRPRH